VVPNYFSIHLHHIQSLWQWATKCFQNVGTNLNSWCKNPNKNIIWTTSLWKPQNPCQIYIHILDVML
jgi:hypothetical protein